MECVFKKDFDVLKKEITKDNNKVKHVINLNGELVFISGIYRNIDSFDYLFTEKIAPYIVGKLKDMDGVFYGENYLFDKSHRSKYEYIIKFEDKEKYKLSDPLVLCVNKEWEGSKEYNEVNHSGYYGCGTITGLSFNSGGVIGFLPKQYIPMLKGETNRAEYFGGRWNKLMGFTEYSIKGGDDLTKEFIISKTNKEY